MHSCMAVEEPRSRSSRALNLCGAKEWKDEALRGYEEEAPGLFDALTVVGRVIHETVMQSNVPLMSEPMHVCMPSAGKLNWADLRAEHSLTLFVQHGSNINHTPVNTAL